MSSEDNSLTPAECVNCGDAFEEGDTYFPTARGAYCESCMNSALGGEESA